MSLSRFDRPIPIPAHVPEYQGPAFSPTDDEDSPTPSYRPTSYSPASPTSCSLASLSLDPYKDALNKQRRHSPAVNTVSNDDEKRAKIALEYYNKENGTNYELACALLSNGFKSDRTWVHCNFAAWQPNRDLNGMSSRRLFFAEMHGDDVTTCTWTVTACIVLEGATTVGCSLCSEVIHPTHGFHQGHQKPKYSFLPTTYLPTSLQPTSYNSEQLKPYKDELPSYSHLSSSYSPTVFLPNSYSPTSDLLNPHRHTMSKISAASEAPLVIPSAEPYYHECAEIALEYYNTEKGANYELVDVLACKCMSSGTWFHCNFTAKPPNGDFLSKLFFGEIYLTTLTVTACVILEEGSKTTDGCYLCPDSEVIHPTQGFLKGLDKNEVRIYSNPETKFMLKHLVGGNQR